VKPGPIFLHFGPSSEKIHVWTLENFNVILDPLLGAVACGAEVTQFGDIDYGAKVRAALAQMDVVAPTWYRAVYAVNSKIYHP
jgi:hypothetical protein